MRTVLSFLIVLHCLRADASMRITVEKPILSLVSSDPQLRNTCAARGAYDACTRFLAYRLQAGCSRIDDRWRVVGASAAFRPYILLRNPQSLPHELEHIEDLRRAVEGLLVEMEETAFDTEAECRARVAQEQGAFGATMQKFALESNLARHPHLRKAAR